MGHCIVVRVADAANRGLDAGLGEPLRVAGTEILNAVVAMMNEVFFVWPFMKRLLQGIVA